MSSLNNILSSNKRPRNEEEIKEITLKIKKQEVKFDLLSYKLNQAEILFMEYEAMKMKNVIQKNKWNNISG